MKPKFNLLILHSEDAQALSDWIAVKETIDLKAPEIETRIVDTESPDPNARDWQGSHPSLVFSASRIGAYNPAGGTVLISPKIPEELQYPRLAAAGVSAPKTMELMLGMVLKPDVWGEYVIFKPIGTTQGSNIRLVQTKDVGRRFAALTNIYQADDLKITSSTTRALVKRYVNSVDKRGFPIEYRVLTMFGTILYAAKIRATERRPPLSEFAREFSGIPSSDEPSIKRNRTLTFDDDVLQLARAAAAVFPEAACLGIDILRESATGELFVIEVNSGGQIWNFSSYKSNAYNPAFRRSLYSQFNALELAADLLIEKTLTAAS